MAEQIHKATQSSFSLVECALEVVLRCCRFWKNLTEQAYILHLHPLWWVMAGGEVPGPQVSIAFEEGGLILL